MSYNIDLELVSAWARIVEFVIFEVHIVDLDLIVYVLHLLCHVCFI